MKNNDHSLDRADMTIAALSVTAVIFLVGLFVLTGRPGPAYGGAVTVTGGPYVMSVGRSPLADEEFVYVLHSPSQRLAVYRFDASRQEVVLAQGFDMTQLRTESADPGSQGRRGRP